MTLDIYTALCVYGIHVMCNMPIWFAQITGSSMSIKHLCCICVCAWHRIIDIQSAAAASTSIIRTIVVIDSASTRAAVRALSIRCQRCDDWHSWCGNYGEFKDWFSDLVRIQKKKLRKPTIKCDTLIWNLIASTSIVGHKRVKHIFVGHVIISIVKTILWFY